MNRAFIRTLAFCAALGLATMAAAGEPAASQPLTRKAIIEDLTRQVNVVPGQTSPEASVALPIEFTLGSDVLTPEARALLDTVISALNDEVLIANTFFVEGHTDSVGDAIGNLTLSQRRANAVLVYLAAGGVSAGRLTPIGYGESRPLANLADNDGRNRRVMIVREL